MSFYVGKYNGNAQCHITHGVDTLTTMRGGVVADTVFHSDVAYPSFVSYDIVTHYDAVVNPWPGERSPPPESSYPQVTFARIPATALTQIKAGRAYLILDSNNIPLIPVPMDVHFGANSVYVGKAGIGQPWAPYTYYVPPHFVTRSPTYVGSPDTQYTGEVAPVLARGARASRILVFNFSSSGYIQYPTPSGSAITMNPNTFIVDNIDIAALKYITGTAINSIDVTGTQSGSGFTPYQLVNSNPSSGGITIQSDSSGTFVKVGTKFILRSDKPVPTYSSLVVTTGDVAVTSFGERLILTVNAAALSNGDLLFASLVFKVTTYISPYTWINYFHEPFLFTYTEGKTYYLQQGLFRVMRDLWDDEPEPTRGGSYYLKCSGGYVRLYNNNVSLGGLADDAITQNPTLVNVTANSLRMH